MLAIRKLARGIANVSVEEMPVPVAGPEEIVAEVDSAWICGTDLHIYLDEFETAPPVTLGHEFAGLTGPGPIGLLALQLAKAAGASVALLGIEADRGRLAPG